MTSARAMIMAKEAGFTSYGIFKRSDISPSKEVRDMCSADKCSRYSKSWSCPPACGSLEYFSEELKRFSWGILLQMTGNMEDDFDAEAMLDTEEKLKKSFESICQKLAGLKEVFMPLSAGSCTVCSKCTYPDAPCRFPDKMFPSMEAAGLLVSEVCSAAGTAYYYGEKTITFSSCILFE